MTLKSRFRENGVPLGLLIVLYVLFYRDVIFFPHIVTGVDFQLPPYTPTIPLQSLFSPWVGWGFGVPSGVGAIWSALITGFLELVAGSNYVVAQKFLFSGIPLAAVAMYVSLRGWVGQKSAFFGSILFAFGPPTTWNFGTGIVWSYSLLPLVIRFSFDSFQRRQTTDVLKLALVLSISAAFGPHYLPLIPLIWLPIIALTLLSSQKKMLTLVSLTKVTALFAVVFLALNPGYLTLAQLIFTQGNRGSSLVSAQALPSRDIAYLYSIYDKISIMQLFTLSNWLPYSYLVGAGLIWPLMGFSSILVSKRKEILALATGEILLVSLVLVIQNRVWVFPWMYGHLPLLQILSDGFMVSYLSWAIVIALSAFFFDRLDGHIQRTFGRIRALPLRRFLSVMPLLFLLVVYFLYVPAFEPRAHVYSSYSGSAGPVANPPVYNLVFSWLRNQPDFNLFNYYLVPYAGTAGPNMPGQAPNFFAPPSIATEATARYVNFVQSVFVQNITQRLGALLAPANVKYVISVMGTQEPDIAKWRVEGQPDLQQGGQITGSPTRILQLLQSQIDLRLIESNHEYFIFENTLFMPKIAVYPNLGYVVGDRITIAKISEIPTLRFRDFALTFPEQSTDSELGIANYVIMNDRDWYDAILLPRLANYVISLPLHAEMSDADLVGWSLARYDNNVLTKSVGLTPSHFLEGSGYFNQGGLFLDADGPANLKFRFSNDHAERHAIFLRALYSPSSTGRIRAILDQVELGTQKPFVPSFLGFKWSYLGTVNLEAGSHDFSIASDFGYAAVDSLAIVPESQVRATLDSLTADIEKKNFLGIFSADYPGLSRGNSNSSVMVPDSTLQDWEGLDSSIKVSVGSSILNGFPTIMMAGIALSSLHDQTAMALATNLTLTGDYLQIWVKSTTPNLGIAIRGLPSRNYELLSIFQTHLIPNEWTSVLVPIDDTMRSKILGQIQIFQGGGSAGLYQEMTVGPIFDVSILSREYELRFGRISSNEILVRTSGECGKPQVLEHGQPVELNGLGPCWFKGLANSSEDLKITTDGKTQLVYIVIIRQQNTTATHPMVLSTKTMGSDFSIQGVSFPAFLVVGTAFDLGWEARTGDANLQHFQAFSFLNGFYVKSTGNLTVQVSFTSSLPLIVTWASVLSAITVIMTIFLSKRVRGRPR